VSDDGWVVIRTANVLSQPCELLAVSPTGQDTARVDILRTLLPDGDSFFKYVRHSSAGYMWGAASCHPYFVRVRNRAHFCFTTWWGARLLLDLPAGRIVPVSSDLEPELFKAEKSFVISTLEGTRRWEYDLARTINPGLTKGSPGPAASEVIGALFMAVHLKMVEAEPLLRELESSPIVLTTSGGSSPYVPPSDGIKPAVYQNLTVRQAAQLALRRLNLQPSRHQTTRVYRAKTYWQPDDPLPFQRESRVQDLKSGMKPEEVMDLIGAPDVITHHGWEYDLDGESPATLVIHWGSGGVESFERVEPPKWRDGVERDVALTR